jgi:hypothetical protein
VVVELHDVANRGWDWPSSGGEPHKVPWRCRHELFEGGLVALAPGGQSSHPVVGTALCIEIDPIRPADKVCRLEVTEGVHPVGGALGQEAERTQKLPELSDVGAHLLRGGKQ